MPPIVRRTILHTPLHDTPIAIATPITNPLRIVEQTLESLALPVAALHMPVQVRSPCGYLRAVAVALLDQGVHLHIAQRTG